MSTQPREPTRGAIRRPIRWEVRAFDSLDALTLYKVIQLREEVFVVEQDCPYLDCDGNDPVCDHAIGWVGTDVIATARIVPAGVKYTEASIGRVVVSPKARGRQAGVALMHQAIAAAHARTPRCAVRISAQAHLQRFYESLGFVRQSPEPYLEDNIPHVEMLLPAAYPLADSASTGQMRTDPAGADPTVSKNVDDSGAHAA